MAVGLKVKLIKRKKIQRFLKKDESEKEKETGLMLEQTCLSTDPYCS